MTAEVPARLVPPVGEGDHQKGPEGAPVILVEYGDYECPYCGRADPIIQELQERLDREIRYVFRHFPITTTHTHAQKASEAAEAAAAQGKFWEMHHCLFANQEALDEADLLRYAERIGLDTVRFQRELDEGIYAERVHQDFLSGVRSGANATPTFFIDGVRYDGAWDLESLMEAIEKPLGRRVSSLAQEFTRLAASGGIVLLVATLLAMLWANSPWTANYFQLWETKLAFTLGNFTFSKSLLEWVDQALMVIAIFYTTSISWGSLAVGAIFLLALIGLNRARVYSPLPYALLGIGLWLAFLQSGIHPTIAGLLLALTIPTRSPPNTRTLLAQVVSLLEGFNLPQEWRSEPDARRQATINTLEVVSERMRSPAQRLERDLNPWTTYLILPLFALANAGVALSARASDGAAPPSLLNPVALGILCGLVLGKPLGVSLFSWLAVRLGLAELPSGVGWPQMLSASWLAGIGFTISLFINNAAFGGSALQTTAKLAILASALLAAALGWGFLRLTSPSCDQFTKMNL